MHGLTYVPARTPFLTFSQGKTTESDASNVIENVQDELGFDPPTGESDVRLGS